MDLLAHLFAAIHVLGHRRAMEQDLLRVKLVLSKVQRILDQENYFRSRDGFVLFPKLVWVNNGG